MERNIETVILRTTDTTVAELAEKHNCSIETSQTKSQRDQVALWSKQRAKKKEKLRKKLNKEEVNIVLFDSVRYNLLNIKLV